MLLYGPRNILTQTMILLRLELKLSNVFVAFDNSAARNVKIVECHRSFDNSAVFRVQFVGYRWFIRQFPKIREPVVSKFPYSPDLFDILALIGAGITEYRFTVRFLGPTIIYLFTKSLGICANTIEPN